MFSTIIQSLAQTFECSSQTLKGLVGGSSGDFVVV